MTAIIILLGFAFGYFLQYSKVNTYNTISGMAILEDFTVAKTIATAIGIGAIILSIEVGTGLASFYVKPFVLGSITIGGLIFGVGMAVLGYCPGTMPVSLGQGSLDAFVGMLGGFVSSLLYTLLSPFIHNALGPDLGKLSLISITNAGSPLFYIITILTGSAFIALSFWLNMMEKKKDMKWFVSAFGIAVVACIIFAASNRVLGASSFYPFFADKLTGLTTNEYFIEQVNKQGFYEMKFLIGAFLSGLIFSLIKGEFKLRLMHENWTKYKGNSIWKRVIWAFIGGFLLLFGARLANGCTSGHVISGGMQLAVSSFVFAICVFAGFLLTGRFFYKKNK